MNWRRYSYFLSRNLGIIGLLPFIGLVLAVIWRKQRRTQMAAESLQRAIANDMHEPITLHPEIDLQKCTGCGACVRACPEGEILKIIDHRSVMVNATKCLGHGQCEVACPFGAISLVFGTKTRGMELPRISTHYESNVKGLYIVGELAGMGLIRNATRQGRIAIEHAAKTLGGGKRSRKEWDVVIVGAGPAGFAASLAAHGLGLNYICIDQNSFGGTIYNFPRQKIVMSQPIELPTVGPVAFKAHKSSKEELLSLWNAIRRRRRLRIKEKTRFLHLTQEGGGFVVETDRGTMRARKVVLAIGVRGTPRQLGLVNEDLPKVTYNLLDPAQYQGRHIAVVGGGNAAAEAAQYLSRPEYGNKVFLLVRGPSFNRCNEENERLIKESEKRGEVKIMYHTTVTEIRPREIVVDQHGKLRLLPNDFLFVMIGAEMPTKFLQGLGIKLEKKFGEPLRRA